MHIGIVGGLDRNEHLFRTVAEKAGHEVELHQGHVGGRGSVALEHLIGRCELVVVVTDVNSHGSVQLTRRIARAKKIGVRIMRRLSVASFAGMLEELSQAA